MTEFEHRILQEDRQKKMIAGIIFLPFFVVALVIFFGVIVIL